MASESTPCNVEDVTSAFIMSPKYIHERIENKIKSANTLFTRLIERKVFEYGHGYIKYKEEFHGSPGIQDGGASWKVMAPYRAPGTLGPTDAGYDPCKSTALIVSRGIEEKQYTVYETERRTMDVCLTDMLFFWQLEQTLALWYQSLTQVSLDEWEQITSEAYLSFCQKLIVRESATDTNTGLDTFTIIPDTGSTFGGSIAVPAGGLGTVGTLTTEVLDRVYQYLVRQVSSDGFLGMNDGMPLIGLAASQETIGDLIKQDSKEVTALYWAQPGINIEGYGKMRTYKNWVQYNDWKARRYKVSHDGTKLERVYPWKLEPTTIGEAMNVNSDYVNAPFELSVAFIKRVYMAQVPPPNPATMGGGFEFNPVDNIMDWEFINIPERCDNPRREKGFFLARGRMAPEPDINSAYSVSFLHRRCNVTTITQCNNCTTTAVSVSVTAATQYYSGVTAANAHEWILTCNECLTAQIGDRIAFTETAPATPGVRYGIVVDNWAGTTILVALDTAADCSATTAGTLATSTQART